MFDCLAQLPKDWPTHGRIEFQNLFLNYSQEDPPVLKDLNFVIENGWKVTLFLSITLKYFEINIYVSCSHGSRISIFSKYLFIYQSLRFLQTVNTWLAYLPVFFLIIINIY